MASFQEDLEFPIVMGTTLGILLLSLGFCTMILCTRFSNRRHLLFADDEVALQHGGSPPSSMRRSVVNNNNNGEDLSIDPVSRKISRRESAEEVADNRRSSRGLSFDAIEGWRSDPALREAGGGGGGSSRRF